MGKGGDQAEGLGRNADMVILLSVSPAPLLVLGVPSMIAEVETDETILPLPVSSPSALSDCKDSCERVNLALELVPDR